MSQTCPRCGLFSADEASRCDCGYDFATNTVKESYLLDHVLQKSGGERGILDKLSHENIRASGLLLVLVLILTVVAAMRSGDLYVWSGGLLAGALLLSRGLRQRRQKSLDDKTKSQLLR